MIEITCKPHPTNSLHHIVTIFVKDHPAYYGMMTLNDLHYLTKNLYGEAAQLTGYIYKHEKETK